MSTSEDSPSPGRAFIPGACSDCGGFTANLVGFKLVDGKPRVVFACDGCGKEWTSL